MKELQFDAAYTLWYDNSSGTSPLSYLIHKQSVSLLPRFNFPHLYIGLYVHAHIGPRKSAREVEDTGGPEVRARPPDKAEPRWVETLVVVAA